MPKSKEQRTEANMARLRARVESAIRDGERVQPFKSTQGSFLQVGNQRVKLQNKDGALTAMGTHYWEHIQEDPPLMYSYDQPLINNQWVKGYNGKRVRVRKKVNGQWQITKDGENYYRYNKNEYVVHVPCRRVVHMGGDVSLLKRL